MHVGNLQPFQSKTVKVNVDQHASKIMWFYGLRKKIFVSSSALYSCHHKADQTSTNLIPSYENLGKNFQVECSPG